MERLGSFELVSALAGIQHMRVLDGSMTLRGWLRTDIGFLLEFTYEGASDVSPFHTCLTYSLHLPVVWLLLVLFWFVFGWILQVLGGFLSIPSGSLDDRQCFTARSARLKTRRRISRKPKVTC